MNLTRKQKKYLKKHLKRDSVEKIALSVGISVEKINGYLREKWGKKKYQSFWAKHGKAIGHKYSSEKGFNLGAWFNKNRWRILILAVLIIVTYANSINNAFLSDDINGIAKNPQIDHIQYIFSNRFSFFHTFVYWFTNQFFGRSPAAFRTVSIFFHLGTTISVLFLVSLLFSSKVGFVAALLFAVHPLLCESVVWISAGYNTYAAFWLLVSFSLFILSSRTEKIKSQKSIFQYWFAVFTYLFALGSSEKVIAFPIILFLYQIAWGKLRRQWPKLIPFFALSLVWGIYLLGALSSRSVILQQNFYQQAPKISSPNQFITTTLRNTVVAVDSYLGLIVWPKGLTLYHSEMHFSKAKYTMMVIAFLGYLGAIIYSYFRDKKISFWLLFFIIMLLPTLSPFGVSWIVAERYTYLASIGIFVVIALFFSKIEKIKNFKDVSWVILGLVIIALSARTIIRNHDWKNQDNLWLAAAKTSPSSPQNHNNLGDLYYRHHETEKAIKEFRKAIELNPGYAAAYHNLANTYYINNRNIDEAIKNYQKAVAINPHLWQSYQNLGKIYFDQKDYPKAIDALQKAIRGNPKNLALRFNLAVVYLKTGKKQKAEETLEAALRIDPNNLKINQLLSTINKQTTSTATQSATPKTAKYKNKQK